MHLAMTEGSGGRHATLSVTIGHAPVAHHEAHIVWGGQPGRLEAMQGPNIINVPEGVVLDTFDDAPGTNGTRHLDAVVSGGDPGRLVAMQGPNVIDVPEGGLQDAFDRPGHGVVVAEAAPRWEAEISRSDVGPARLENAVGFEPSGFIRTRGIAIDQLDAWRRA